MTKMMMVSAVTRTRTGRNSSHSGVLLFLLLVLVAQVPISSFSLATGVIVDQPYPSSLGPTNQKGVQQDQGQYVYYCSSRRTRQRTRTSSLWILTSSSLDDDEASSPPSSSSAEESSSVPPTSPILCDLQTFLRLVDAVSTGGSAKMVIQGGKVNVNGSVETRRAKKLFKGDIVQFQGRVWKVATVVQQKNYTYPTPKPKKIKPLPEIMPDGSLEFGGKYRSDTWRKERKQRKEERRNSATGGSKKTTTRPTTSTPKPPKRIPIFPRDSGKNKE